jgi:hypothetical protein
MTNKLTISTLLSLTNWNSSWPEELGYGYYYWSINPNDSRMIKMPHLYSMYQDSIDEKIINFNSMQNLVETQIKRNVLNKNYFPV